jgi:Antitoxin VbhA
VNRDCGGWALTRFPRRYIMARMSKPSKDTRSAAEKARDTASIVGSLKHEGYVPTPEAEAVHQRVARGEITTEEAIKIFRDRALKQDAELTARQRRPERA